MVITSDCQSRYILVRLQMPSYASPFPEHIRTALVLVLALALQGQVITYKWHFLLLGKVLAASEVFRELACAKLNCVCSCEVCTTCGQPLLVIQFLSNWQIEKACYL